MRITTSNYAVFRSFVSVIVLSAFVACVTETAGENTTWPQWRGRTRDGKLVHDDPWPGSLTGDHLKPLWRVELSPGYSSPIVTPKHVIVLESKDKKYEVVRALDRNTGDEIWTTKWEGAMTVDPMGARTGSWIKSTPTYDGKHLYVAGMRDVLVCLDETTGAEIWRVDFVKRYKTPIPELGFICSPLVVDDSVYVQAADSFLRLDKATGKTVWRTLIEEEKGHGSYSSPGIATIHGRPQLLVAMISDIAGVDPSSGTVLWSRRLDSIEQGCILTPIAFGNDIFTSTRHSRSGLYGLTHHDDKFSVREIWKNKATAYMSAPIIIGDHAYMHLKSNRMMCLNLNTGEECWTSSKGMGMYCSMISLNDRILLLTSEGELMLLRASPQRFDLIDSRKIADSETWGHLAISKNRLYVREFNGIAAFLWQ